MIFGGFFGLMLGSFLNVCIHRWPKEESVVKPRSRCPGCGKMIAWYDNIPVLSWLVLGGKCRNCKAAISIQYPLIELTTGIIWVFMAWRYGATVTALQAA